jgi:hypothetical protein
MTLNINTSYRTYLAELTIRLNFYAHVIRCTCSDEFHLTITSLRSIDFVSSANKPGSANIESIATVSDTPNYILHQR